MTKTLNDILAARPVDEDRIEAHQQRMLAEVRAYRLRELREQAGLTQARRVTTDAGSHSWAGQGS